LQIHVHVCPNTAWCLGGTRSDPTSLNIVNTQQTMGPQSNQKTQA